MTNTREHIAAVDEPRVGIALLRDLCEIRLRLSGRTIDNDTFIQGCKESDNGMSH